MDNSKENFYVVKNEKINQERIMEICKKSDFAKSYGMQEYEGGYISNVKLTPPLKNFLGVEDIFDEEVYLAYFAPYNYPPYNLNGGFAVTKFGIFIFYFGQNKIERNYISFEELAEKNRIYEGLTEAYKTDTFLIPLYNAGYHFLNADDIQIAFFLNTTWYDNLSIRDLFCEIASSVRRDLGFPRLYND